MRRCLVFILLFPAFFQAKAQFDSSDSAIRKRIWTDIHILASDSLQGRKSGTSGESKAASYIIRSFIETGLLPLGSDSGSYLQTFPMEQVDYGLKWQSNHLKLNGRNCSYMEGFGPVSFSANGRFTGKISEKFVWKDGKDPMKSVNIENKLLLVNLSNIHDSLDEENQLSVKDARKLAATLFSTGAAGVIFWDSNARYYKDFFNFKECDTLPGPVIFVSYAVGKRLSAAKQETYAELLISKPVVVTKKCHNIIGYIDNHAPCTIVVGAHYDHLGISRKNEIRYGSDDNASGTVTLMELSRFLKNSGNKQNNYLFIAFSGEEEGLVGSGYFCVNPTIDLKTINFMFNFDMVGRLGCEGNRVTAISTGSSPEWKRIFSETPHPGFRIKKMKGGAAFSDHYGFYKKGIPVAYLTTGMHYDYHTPKDTPDKINYDGMVSITKYAEDFIRQSEEQGRIEYSKVPGWYNFTCTTSFIWSELDYIFHEGFDGME